ncbi:EpsG family protein [Eubacterium limosum]|nr:EpsG family protein [Eubacterium limosum]
MRITIEIILIWGFVFLGIALTFIENKLTFAKRKKVLFVFICCLILFFTFRTIGLDLPNYYAWYNKTNIANFEELYRNSQYNNFEPFFVVEVFLLKMLNLGFRSFLFINISVPLLIIYRIIIKNTKRVCMYFSMFLVINIFYFDVIRAFFASTIFFLAIMQKNKIKKFSLFVFDYFIHYSTIVATLSYLFMNKKINIKIIVKVFVVSAVIVLFLNVLINNNLFSTFSVGKKFEMYLFADENYNFLSKSHYFLFYTMKIFPTVIAFFMLCFCYHNYKNYNFDEMIIYNYVLIGGVIMVACLGVNALTLGSRLFQVFSLGIFYLIGKTIEMNNNKTVLYGIVCIVFVLYNFIMTLYYMGIFSSESSYYIGF